MIVSPQIFGGAEKPFLADFTWLEQTAGATATDTAGGLEVFSPQVGHGNTGKASLAYNSSVGSTFTVTAQLTTDFNSTLSGASQPYGPYIFVRDAVGGKAFSFGLSRIFPGPPNDSGNPGGRPIYGRWNGLTAGQGWDSWPLGEGSLINPVPQVIQVGLAGTILTFSYGPAPSSLTVFATVDYTSWLANPPHQIGILVIDTDSPALGMDSIWSVWQVR